jgi:hypothetical protein
VRRDSDRAAKEATKKVVLLRQRQFYKKMQTKKTVLKKCGQKNTTHFLSSSLITHITHITHHTKQ